MNTITADPANYCHRCADTRPCEHVAALTSAGQTAIHVMGLPDHGRMLLAHARLLAELHGHGNTDEGVES